MDILNFISWIRGKRQVTSVDPTKTLIPVALKDGRRDDEYLTGAISVEDFASQIGGNINLTTSGTGGAATLSGSNLNIPQYQTQLVSNSNIKTINGTSVLGSGNIVTTSSIGTTGTTLYSVNPAAGTNLNSSNSIVLGLSAGQDSSNADNSNFFGNNAGFNSSNANYSNFLGSNAGANGVNANDSNFFGGLAGQAATNASNSNFLGREAGRFASNASNSNFLGFEAGANSSGSNVNAFGYRAHKGGSLSGQTVFANATIPSYADRAAAVAAITIGSGAVANNTYLYYNQTTFAIEGVRL